MKHVITFAIIVFLGLTSHCVGAQDSKSTLKSLAKEDSDVIEAIVSYPQEARENIFVVAQYPALLLRLDALQQKSKKAFQLIIEGLDRKTQEDIYDLTRYPELIDTLSNSNNRKKDLEKLYESYPEDVQDAIDNVIKEKKVLIQLAELNQITRLEFKKVLSKYPDEAIKSTKNLVKNPELLSLLVANIDMTILTGDIYKEDPNWISEKAEELSLQAAKKQVEELNDYKEQLEKDPEALKDMVEAAELYAKENNIEKEKINESETLKVVYSYSYWYGYPYWYTYPYWTPRPYYYYTGFYYGPGGVIIIVGLPSYHYVHWHYRYYPHRHVHLHAHYHRHYRRHPNSRSGLNVAVDANVNRNTNISKNQRSSKKLAKPNKSNNRDIQNKVPKDEKYRQFRNNDRLKGNWSSRKPSTKRRG